MKTPKTNNNRSLTQLLDLPKTKSRLVIKPTVKERKQSCFQIKSNREQLELARAQDETKKLRTLEIYSKYKEMASNQ